MVLIYDFHIDPLYWYSQRNYCLDDELIKYHIIFHSVRLEKFPSNPPRAKMWKEVYTYHYNSAHRVKYYFWLKNLIKGLIFCWPLLCQLLYTFVCLLSLIYNRIHAWGNLIQIEIRTNVDLFIATGTCTCWSKVTHVEMSPMAWVKASMQHSTHISNQTNRL